MDCRHTQDAQTSNENKSNLYLLEIVDRSRYRFSFADHLGGRGCTSFTIWFKFSAVITKRMTKVENLCITIFKLQNTGLQRPFQSSYENRLIMVRSFGDDLPQILASLTADTVAVSFALVEATKPLPFGRVLVRADCDGRRWSAGLSSLCIGLLFDLPRILLRLVEWLPWEACRASFSSGAGLHG